MPHATLTIVLPEGTWIGDISRTYSETRFRVLAAIPSGTSGVGLAKLQGPNVNEVVSEVKGRETVDEFTLLYHRRGEALIQVETSVPIVLHPLRDSGVPFEMPFDVENGRAEIEVTSTHERLSMLGAALDEYGLTFTVERLEQSIESGSLLTDRQLELLREAITAGYYDSPRTSTLTELAEEVGLAKSTCSEILHRAEGRIIRKYLQEQMQELPEKGIEPPVNAD